MLHGLLVEVGAPVAGLALLLLAFVLGMRAKSPVVLETVKRIIRVEQALRVRRRALASGSRAPEATEPSRAAQTPA